MGMCYQKTCGFMNQDKPRLWKRKDCWFCLGQMKLAFGKTLIEAYNNWRNV